MSPTKVRQTRIPWGTLSREQIVDAALAVVRRGDYEQMTIRSLAAELGAAPMSLYRHVRDRDDLLDEVVDLLLAAAWRPSRAPDGDWKEWVTEACDRLRGFLVAEPAALHVYLRHPVVSPAAVDRMATVLAVLRSAGLDDEEAGRAYAAVHTYTVGFAALEGARTGWAAANENASELALQLASYATPQQFREGLGYLLDAVGRRVG